MEIFMLMAIFYLFRAYDILFVKAGDEHRFIDFTDDFSTWVIFMEFEMALSDDRYFLKYFVIFCRAKDSSAYCEE